MFADEDRNAATVVVDRKADGRYVLIAGHRTFAAAEEDGAESALCRIRESTTHIEPWSGWIDDVCLASAELSTEFETEAYASQRTLTHETGTLGVPAPTIPDRLPAEWNDVRISFISDHKIQIAIKGRTGPPCNYNEMGFEDRRNRLPNKAWGTLLELAKARGTLKGFREPQKVHKRIQHIRRILRDYARKEHFEIPGDPLPYVKREGYKAVFTVTVSPSFDT